MTPRTMLVTSFTLLIAVGALAQNVNQEPTTRELQRQLDEMRSEMATMRNRITELEAARGIATTSSSTDSVQLPTPPPPARAFKSQPDEAKSVDEPMPFHFKGLTLTPGGFLEGTMLVRTRNENADIANSYSAIPLNGSSN